MKNGMKGRWPLIISVILLFQLKLSMVDSCKISPTVIPKDCFDVKRMGFHASGAYGIYVNNTQTQVYCDFDTPGGDWLVFQRRKDGSVDFKRNWNNYSTGFGDLNGEFWLGNENLFQLTSNRKYKLRIDLEDFDNQTRFAEYGIFSIGPSSDHYRLKIGNYSGDAGDAMAHHNNDEFSTFDVDLKDGGVGGCAKAFHGAWWYDNVCHQANLNGLYLRGVQTSMADGINWFQWHGFFYSLKTTEMKITPSN